MVRAQEGEQKKSHTIVWLFLFATPRRARRAQEGRPNGHQSSGGALIVRSEPERWHFFQLFPSVYTITVWLFLFATPRRARRAQEGRPNGHQSSGGALIVRSEPERWHFFQLFPSVYTITVWLFYLRHLAGREACPEKRSDEDDRALKGPNGSERFREPFVVRSQVVRWHVDVFSDRASRREGL
ncbi:hypothetical protein D3A96_02575 [Robertkochia marina]|nr:hypothetical protein D3A96_02575 [Robertkochia marina]